MISPTKSHVLRIVILTSLTTACGGSRSESPKATPGKPVQVQVSTPSDPANTNGNSNPNSTPSTDETTIQIDNTPTGSATELAGLWKAPCAKSPDRDHEIYGLSHKSQAAFSGSKVILASDIYIKSNCQSYSSTVIVTSTFTVKNLPGAAKTIDFLLEKIELVPRTSAEASNMNELESYSITDWKKDVPRDITGKRMLPEEPKPLPTSGTKLYDIYDVSADKLRFGLSTTVMHAADPDSPIINNGSAPDKRPTTIDSAEIFTKTTP